VIALNSLLRPLREAPIFQRLAAGFAVLAGLTVGLPHGFVSNALLLALGFGLIAAALAQRRAPIAPGHERAEWRWIAFLLAGWCAWCLLRIGLSLLWSEPISWSGIGHVVALPLPFALAYGLRAQLRPLAAWVLPAGLMGVALLALLNYAFPGNTLRLFEGYRIYLGNDSIAIDVMLAILAAGGVLSALAHWQRGDKARIGLRALCAVLACAPLVAFGQSRSAYIVFFISVLLGTFLLGKNWRQRFGVAAVVLAFVAAAYAASPMARARMERAVAEVNAAVTDHYIATSQGQRLAMASVSWRIVKDRPILGHGVGAWRTEFAAHMPPQWKFAIGRHTSPHNEYLHIASQLGLVGAAIFAALLLVVLRVGVDTMQRQQTPWLFLLALGLLVGSITNVMLWDFRFWAAFTAMLTFALVDAGPAPASSQA
jgi:O-antigen ligase